MCSIFGFVSTRDKGPDIQALMAIIEANIGRGPHAFGFSWIDGNNRLRSFKMCGNLADHIGFIGLVKNARMMVGHLRYATHGDVANNINNHPHASDGGWIVHNGVVTNYADLARKHRMFLSSECDSESIANLIERGTGSRVRRAAMAVKKTTGACAILGLWNNPATLVAVRRGNPLHYSKHHGDLYIASLGEGLPAKAIPFRDGDAVSLRLRDGKIMQTREQIPTRAGNRFLWAGPYRGG